MGEQQTDWSAAFLFVLWALIVIFSVAGWHPESPRPKASEAFKKDTRSLSSFTLGTQGSAGSTTREKAR